jgi:hypothetical protein
VNWSNARSDIKAMCNIYRREGETINRCGHYRDEAGGAIIGTLSSETHYKSLISPNKGTSKWRDFERDEEDHH